VITNPLIDTFDCVNDCGISDYVHYIKAIPEDEKPAIYQMASLSVWPSLYEGFGIPILEAMASGVPVI
jgi:glycosyltransferase involved in cell wall biosynthesis